MIIRKARKNDIEPLSKLVEQLIDYIHQIDKYYKSSSGRSGLKSHLNKQLKNKLVRVFIAEEKDEIIGYIVGSIMDSPSWVISERNGLIEDAFIKENYRRKGAGVKLFNELLSWFKKEKIRYITLGVHAKNKIGINAWKKFGFIEYGIKMRLDSKQ
jgi:[ribosomal protein S18]-alanine N-acetyltransferase